MVIVAMFVVAVPTAVAQSPLGDQYQTDESVPGSSSGAAGGPEVAVDVQNTSAGADGSLPFTGGQIALVALLGLGLVGLGVVGVAVSRRHESPTAS